MANTGQFDVCCRGTLQVDLHRPGIFGMFQSPISASCVEFSVVGIDVETDVDLKVGQHLVIDLQMHDLRVEELSGVVQSVAVQGDHRRYRIDFRIEGQLQSRGNTLHCLRHIETHVRQLSHAG